MKRLTALALALVAANLYAREINAVADGMAKARTAAGVMPGIMVATIVDGREEWAAYGIRSKADPRAPDANTVYEIGSTTKTFTALLLADAAARGAVKLDQPVASLLPGYTIPAWEGRAITLADLATQSSALPRLPGNMAPKQADNPYADYSEDQLRNFLSSVKLTRAPGAQYEYSNLGFGLLGQALSHQAGKPYAALVAERITTPLGMADTGIELTPGMKANLAPGHAGGKQVANWDIPTLAGAGAIRSTTHDMLTYLKAAMAAARNSSDTPMRTVQQPRRTVAPGMDIGLAWHIRDAGTQKVVWHNGMTGGYASFIAFTDDGKRGVVVLTNAQANVDDIGISALLPPPDTAKGPQLDAAALAEYTGRYQLMPGFVLTIGVEGGQLTAQATGQPAALVFPRAQDEFFYQVVEASLHFKRGTDGKIASLELHQGGRVMPAARLP